MYENTTKGPRARVKLALLMNVTMSLAAEHAIVVKKVHIFCDLNEEKQIGVIS